MKFDLTCKKNFENTNEKIKEIFSTPFILQCYSVNNLSLYNELFTKDEIKELMENEEIRKTAELFLNNDLNLTQASKNAFMHRNTMIYRIEKIEHITGLNIKKFKDAVIFANMVEVYKKFS